MAQKYPLTLHASVYGCLALNTYQQVSKLGNLKKEEPKNVGDFSENISPSGLFKDFECARAQFGNGNQGLNPKLTEGHGLYDSHISGSSNHNVCQIV